MFKVTIENGECTVESQGSLIQIITEVARAVGAVYEGLRKASEIDAMAFKLGVIKGLSADSPAWNMAKDAEGVVIATTEKQKKGDAPTGQSQGTAN